MLADYVYSCEYASIVLPQRGLHYWNQFDFTGLVNFRTVFNNRRARGRGLGSNGGRNFNHPRGLHYLIIEY